MTANSSHSSRRSRMPEVASLSARWWTISHALHLPGIGCATSASRGNPSSAASTSAQPAVYWAIFSCRPFFDMPRTPEFGPVHADAGLVDRMSDGWYHLPLNLAGSAGTRRVIGSQRRDLVVSAATDVAACREFQVLPGRFEPHDPAQGRAIVRPRRAAARHAGRRPDHRPPDRDFAGRRARALRRARLHPRRPGVRRLARLAPRALAEPRGRGAVQLLDA